MATVQECEEAFRGLADKLAAVDPETRKKTVLDRSVTCTLRDLDVTFAGQLRDGGLHDIHQVETPSAQIKLAMASDDLLKLTAGELNFASAWASGRIKVDASIFDLLKLRTLF